MKLKRNTSPAREAALEKRKKRKEELQRFIRTSILPEFKQNSDLSYGCEDCAQEEGCTAPDVRQCMSQSELARTLNSKGIPSIDGYKGRWDASMVRNLFKAKFRTGSKVGMGGFQ